jgi:hypothetical protein
MIRPSARQGFHLMVGELLMLREYFAELPKDRRLLTS